MTIKSLLIFLCFSVCSSAFAAPKTTLLVQPHTIEVDGQPESVYRVVQPDGTWGYTGIEGEMFEARVANQTDKPISMHWHGIVLPNAQDGVPGVTQAKPIEPGAYQDYSFPLVQNGTYWMHTHYGFGEQKQLSAPFIIVDPNDPYPEAKSVTVFLTDYTSKSFADIDSILKSGETPTPTHLNSNPIDPIRPKMTMPAHQSMANHSKPKGMAMGKGLDLNDVNFEVLLTNYKTLADPEIVAVEAGQTVRLRIINGAVGSNFHINLGRLQGTVIATDGHYVQPTVIGSRFGIAIAQRLDIIVTIAQDANGSFPILAQVEGTKYQTGLVLATRGAPTLSLSQKAEIAVGPIQASQDRLFHAKEPLLARKPTRKIAVSLDGNMQDYRWFMNKEAWPAVKPLMVKQGDRVEITLKNNTAMGHPMHLHQYFQVMAINGQALTNGPMRDTVYVPANGEVVIELDTDNPGNWMFHCHILYHMANGMMTVLQYEGVPKATIIREPQANRN